MDRREIAKHGSASVKCFAKSVVHRDEKFFEIVVKPQCIRIGKLASLLPVAVAPQKNINVGPPAIWRPLMRLTCGA